MALFCSQEYWGRQPFQERQRPHFPTLWQVLLAGAADEADVSQRVFGDAETAGLAARANDAHDRLCELAAFLLSHAAHDDAPYCLQLDAAATYLAEMIDAQADDAVLWITANLDELARGCT